MRREEATERVLEAKRKNGLTFSQLAEKVGRPKVWTTAALLRQHPMSVEEAQAAKTNEDLDGCGRVPRRVSTGSQYISAGG
jgi:cyanate lyase